MAISAGSLQFQLGLDAKQYNRGMASASQSVNNFVHGVNQANTRTNAFQKSLIGVGAAVAAVGYSFIKFSKQSFNVASSVAEMNVAMEAVGKATGIGGKTIKDAAKDIRSMGIEMQASQEIAMLFVKGNIELSKAAKVARVAQDLAVLSQSNSTDTARTLTYAIQTGNSVLLKSAGITKYASEAYASYARELKVTESSLTATQRQMAITNMIIKEGSKVAGVYEAAMQEPGKVLRSFPRLLNDIQLEFGNVYLKGFGPAILAAYKLTDAFSKSISSGGALNPILKTMEDAFAGLMKPLAEGIKKLTALFQMTPKVSFNIKQMSKNIQGLVPALVAGSTALSMFAGGKLLSAIPILNKFARPLMKGGPLLGGLGILIAMSPKLRGVFFEIAGALKPLVPAFIEIGKVAIQVVGYIVTTFENVATALQGSLVGVVTGLSVAFMGVAKAVMPVVLALAKFAELVSRNALAVQALAAILVAVMVKSLFATSGAFGMVGKAAIGMSKMFGAAGAAFRAEMTFLSVTTKTQTAIMASSFRAGMAVMAASFKAFMLSITSSLGPMLLITAAVFALVKAFEAFSNRNKDVKETTKNLSNALKDQMKVLKGNETAIRGYLSDVALADKVLLSAEDSGEKLSYSLAVLGISTDKAADTLSKMKDDSKSLTEQIGAQTIGTDRLAQKTIEYINNHDKLSPEKMEAALRTLYVGTQKLTETQITAALALEELQDQSENTDFNALIKSTATATIETSKYGAKAVQTANKLLKLAEDQGKVMSGAERFTFYTKELNKALADEAKKAGDVEDALDPAAPHNYAKEIAGLTAKLAEGDVTADMYAKALFGIYDADNKLNKALHDSQKALGSMLKGLKDAKGSQIKLKDAGYELIEQMGAYQKILTENGGTVADSLTMQKQLRDQFIESARAAKFSEERIKELLVQLGITASIEKLEIDIQVNITKALEALRTFRKYLFASDPDAKVVEDKLLGELNEAIAQSKKTGKFGADAFKGISDAAKNASKDTATVKDAMKALEERIKKQKRAVVEAKQALQDYARSSASALYKAVGVGEVFNRFKASQDKKDAIIERNKQIRAQMEADRVAKERRDAELLIDSKNKLIDAENELINLQNQFANSMGDAVSSMLSFTDVLGQQINATNELSSARDNQAKAEELLAEKQALRTDALAEVALLEEQIANTAGRYKRRVLGEELVKAQELATKATLEFADAQEIVRLAVEETNNAGKKQITFLQGLEEQAKKSLDFAKVITDLADAGLSQDALSQIAGAGADAGMKMGEELMAGGAEAITKANEFVKTIVDEGKKVASKFAKSLKERLEYAIYEDKPVYETLGDEVGESFAESLKKQAEKSKEFAAKVKQLISMGLRGVQLEEVVNAGVDAGTEIADALIAAGSGTIKDSVAMYDELKNMSKKFGDELVPYFDQTGILLAEALLSALKKKLADIDKILKGKSGKEIKDFIDNLDETIADETRNIADKITGTPTPVVATQFATSLSGAKFSNIAEQTAVAKGQITQAQADELFARRVTPFASGGIVKAPTLGLVGEAGAEAVIPLSQLGNFSGSTYNISVSAGMGADGNSIGAQIVEQIKRYEKSNGKRWRS